MADRSDPSSTGAAALPTRVAEAQADALRQQRDGELAALLARSAAGEAQAFEQFYDRCVPHARALARRFVRDAELDDVLADSFFQAWREAARYDVARGSAVSWLLTIVRTRALDLLRQRRASPAAAADEPAADDPPSPDPGPADLLAQAQAGGALQRALAELSSSERWVLGLAYYREMSHADIAAATALPLGTVKSLINRSQRKLRARLAPATSDLGAQP